MTDPDEVNHARILYGSVTTTLAAAKGRPK